MYLRIAAQRLLGRAPRSPAVAPGAWRCDRAPGIDAAAGFDAASRAELLQLMRALDGVAAPPRWQNAIRDTLLRSWSAAAQDEPPWPALVESARRTPPLRAQQAFWRRWIAEQIRLAHGFPDAANELFALHASDIDGAGFADREFALTFDDGPTAAGGCTDATVARLRELGLPATFFVVGERLAARADARTLYAGFAVASHGYTHVPHVDLAATGASLARTGAQLAASVDRPDLRLFRPPYGRRSGETAAWIDAQGMRSVLWNIDSLDWRGDARPESVAGRVLALMLVLRRGVVLFHDVHGVARRALPLVAGALGASVRWRHCADPGAGRGDA
jgi:peptidoglycan/xylan/chitin deacetylase (PgdA/CDA1 family)